MRKKFAFCPICGKEVLKPRRRAMNDMYFNVWILTIISSLGFALIPFLIYRFFILKKRICPICKNRIEFYNSKEDFPDSKTQINRILRTIEQEQSEKDSKIKCPYCQEEISNQETICPVCGTTIQE
ncbi:MAG: zinc ribbon domain-containing protein [Candidatus Lokiarchaeia archaeon]|nr:zinc ribbon domain-containing protein [Candidatus Lokiarchaeia archaeon]